MAGFKQRYAATGRAPYAPRGMMGLILYGIMQGVYSLRSLERFVHLGLGCMWVSNGVAPDHAIIGRFIVVTSLITSLLFGVRRDIKC
ncbi:transposase [Nitrosomonas eutropha]|uniref:transposase n=1 Tax=Nitrosomonas eutropha TaxID=916 RepID=UPI00094508DB